MKDRTKFLIFKWVYFVLFYFIGISLLVLLVWYVMPFLYNFIFDGDWVVGFNQDQWRRFIKAFPLFCLFAGTLTWWQEKRRNRW